MGASSSGPGWRRIVLVCLTLWALTVAGALAISHAIDAIDPPAPLESDVVR